MMPKKKPRLTGEKYKEWQRAKIPGRRSRDRQMAELWDDYRWKLKEIGDFYGMSPEWVRTRIGRHHRLMQREKWQKEREVLVELQQIMLFAERKPDSVKWVLEQIAAHGV